MKSWDADTREEYEERAAIMEFCGAMTRQRAELEARLLIELKLNPPVPQQMTLAAAETEAERFFHDMHEMFKGW